MRTRGTGLSGTTQALPAATPGALDAIPGAVYFCDREGWLLHCNAQATDRWAKKKS
jgi:hypothetical protein